MNRKLDILVPQYKETDEVVKSLLDSILVQQNVNFDEIGVIIVNDGSDVKLSENLINSYPFKVEYYCEEHKGVSATRNACLDHSTADYVMFCDADDMFFNVMGLFIILKEINTTGFDSLVSVFVEEGREPKTKIPFFIERGRVESGSIDSTFVHGKVHRRRYLIDKNIRWDESLTIHEDSYFNILCQKLSKDVKYCPIPFYLWKWRDESVCRSDFKYILKTYNNMLDSSTALVKQFLDRNMNNEAQFYSAFMIYDAYFTMNKDEWINQNNKEFRDKTEKRFKEYYLSHKDLADKLPIEIKNQIIAGIKTRMFGEGLMLEIITFNDWIKHIMKL